MPNSQRKWFLDTNVLIDLAVASRPEHGNASALIVSGGNAHVEFCICVSSLKDMYYILSRQRGADGNKLPEAYVRGIVDRYIGCFTIANLTKESARTAVESDEPDFEDGLIRATAEECKCNLIVTRDLKAFSNSFIKSATPAEALRLLNG